MLKAFGTEQFLAGILKEVGDFEQDCMGEMKLASRTLLQTLAYRTPAWSGQTVMSYRFGIGRVALGTAPSGFGAPARHTRHPHLLAPGTEDNWGPAYSVARSALEGVLNGYKKLDDIYVTNWVPDAKWDLIEHGDAPFAKGGRNPGGVSKLALQGARVTLGNFK